jgi:hypothetical protein
MPIYEVVAEYEPPGATHRPGRRGRGGAVEVGALPGREGGMGARLAVPRPGSRIPCPPPLSTTEKSAHPETYEIW